MESAADVVKASVRETLAERERAVAEAERALWEVDRARALDAGCAIELLRADDELLEERQRLEGHRTFRTQLFDPKGRRRYGPRFTQYHLAKPQQGGEWPLGRPDRSADRAVAHASLLRSRVTGAPDPKAASLEAGAAYACAAAASAKEKAPSAAVASLEKTARHLLAAATKPTNERRVLRRRTKIAVVKEILRRRALMRPEKRRRDERRCRREHARLLAAERRTQRARRSAAHLMLFKDALRAERPFATSPSVDDAHAHVTSYLSLFSLSDDDHTDAEDEHDYDAFCRYFGGDGRSSSSSSSSSKKTSEPDDDRDSETTSPTTSPTEKTLSGEESTTRKHESSLNASSIATGADSLMPAPTTTDLREARLAALKTVHSLLSERGVRHLDGDLSDVRWVPNSLDHLRRHSLGRLADVHVRVLQEMLSFEEEKRDPELLAALGTLRAKAGAIAEARALFLEAARGRRYDDPELLEAESLRTKQAPPTGSFRLPRPGGRYDFALRDEARKLRKSGGDGLVASWFVSEAEAEPSPLTMSRRRRRREDSAALSSQIQVRRSSGEFEVDDDEAIISRAEDRRLRRPRHREETSSSSRRAEDQQGRRTTEQEGLFQLGAGRIVVK